MRVLFDTNVVLDVLLERHPFVALSEPLMSLAQRRHFVGLLCATSVTTIHYFVRKYQGAAAAKRHVADLLVHFEVASVGVEQLRSALRHSFVDYEDAVLHDAAMAAKADMIVTRDRHDFSTASLVVLDPASLLSLIVGGHDPRTR